MRASAAAPTEKRLIIFILRGGLDLLHALAPYADSEYSRVRPTLALSGPSEEGGVIDLNGYFGLHPALAGLYDLFQKKKLFCCRHHLRDTEIVLILMPKTCWKMEVENRLELRMAG